MQIYIRAASYTWTHRRTRPEAQSASSVCALMDEEGAADLLLDENQRNAAPRCALAPNP